MTDKSHVSMEQHVCLVCGTRYDTGALLLDRRLLASMERHTLTGNGLCPDDKARYDAGYIALVECDPSKSGSPGSGHLMDPSKVYRTGRIVHLRRAAFAQIFTTPVKETVPLVFVEPGILDPLIEESKEAAQVAALQLATEEQCGHA